MKLYFVVEMLRNGDREQHSYACGVFDDELLALEEAWTHMNYRACKYEAEIRGFELNGGRQEYIRKLSDWNSFAESSKDLAEKLKLLLDVERL